ncbi:MAG: N-acetylmuramoyl-L-alanine amidase [Coriobacteriia bacterium]|nr:N-acetylmuramoyl-L-alanine amidase [Coriobacteriia bacterium]
MSKGKRLLSVLLAFVLVLPFSGIHLAFAEPEDSVDDGLQALEVFEEDPAIAEDAEGSKQEGLEDLELEGLEDSFWEDPEGLELETSSGAVVNPAEVIEYVYLDEKVVALGQEQNVAFSLLDESAEITQAEITFIKTGTEQKFTFFADVIVDNAALFTFIFFEREDADSYRLSEIAYCLSGSEDVIRADFFTFDEGQEDGGYYFDVVTEELFEVVVAEASEEGELTVFVITDEGDFVSAESVEEALLLADAEGIEDLEADESTGSEAALLGLVPSSDLAEDDPASQDITLLALSASLQTLSVSPARENYLVVALDPGHGGLDPGAVRGDLEEKDLNWVIANACKEELLNYTGVSPVLTRTENENPSLQARVDRAVANGADVFVSLHNNTGGGAGGAEVWYPNNSTYLNAETHVAGEQLSNKILTQLAKLGLNNRGAKMRNATGSERYPDGSISDYYGVISASRKAGIPGIIVEHAFLDVAGDAAKLRDKDFLVSLGKADAQGIVDQYGLVTHTSAQSTSLLKYQSYVGTLGWESFVYDQKVSGTTGKGKAVEAFNIELQNQPVTGSIQYNAFIQNEGWQGWKSDGAVVGTEKQSKAIQVIQIRLTGKMEAQYDVYYRAHISSFGWLDWAKNGASAGGLGSLYKTEAFQVVILPKGAAAPGPTGTPYWESSIVSSSVAYQAHVQNQGWNSIVTNGTVAGTTGLSLRVEALKISLASQGYPGGIQYNAHCAFLGWQGWKNGGEVAGTTGQSRQMEAIQIRLTGEMADRFDVYYRVHSAYLGWLGWAKNGESAGSAGYSYRMEALQIVLVSKGGKAPGSTVGANKQKSYVQYSTHVQNVGWQGYAADGATAGTTGRSLRVEALRVSLVNQQYPGGIQYNAHCALLGWQGWKNGGQIAGTTGQSRQVEAIQIRLTGEMADRYDVYYRVHCANFGWLGWAKNGASAGSAGYGYRMEALQIMLVPKGDKAPGSTAGAFKELAPVSGTPIMGSTSTTVDQMARRYNATGRTYPASVYSTKGAPTIRDFCQIVYEEAIAEGVRPEVVFCQAMYETGWLGFGGDVKVDQCNFCGLGATGSVGGATFSSVREGVRAHVQHLKAYAVPGLKASDLKNPLVDPRFDLVTKGSATTLEALNGKWAVPGVGYGERISSMIDELYKA